MRRKRLAAAAARQIGLGLAGTIFAVWSPPAIAATQAPARDATTADEDIAVVAEWKQLIERGNKAQAAGGYKEAAEYTKKALELSERRLGPHHAATLIAVNNLSSIYQALGQYSEAETLGHRAMKLSQLLLGAEHRATLIATETLAGVFRKQGRFSEASPFF